MYSLPLNRVKSFRTKTTLDRHIAIVNVLGMTLVLLPEMKMANSLQGLHNP
jgi:hypothetical protein